MGGNSSSQSCVAILPDMHHVFHVMARWCSTQAGTAAHVFWNNTTSNNLWETPANWSGNTVPGLVG